MKRRDASDESLGPDVEEKLRESWRRDPLSLQLDLEDPRPAHTPLFPEMCTLLAPHFPAISFGILGGGDPPVTLARRPS